MASRTTNFPRIKLAFQRSTRHVCKDPDRDNSKAECLSYHPFNSGLLLDQFLHLAPNLKNHDASEQPQSLKESLVLFECSCLLMCEVSITSEDRGQSHAPWEGSAWQPGSSVLFCKAVTQRVEDRCLDRSLLRETGWMQEEELTVVVNLGLSHPHHKPLTVTIFLLVSLFRQRGLQLLSSVILGVSGESELLAQAGVKVPHSPPGRW